VGVDPRDGSAVEGHSDAAGSSGNGQDVDSHGTAVGAVRIPEAQRGQQKDNDLRAFECRSRPHRQAAPHRGDLQRGGRNFLPQRAEGGDSGDQRRDGAFSQSGQPLREEDDLVAEKGQRVRQAEHCPGEGQIGGHAKQAEAPQQARLREGVQ